MKKGLYLFLLIVLVISIGCSADQPKSDTNTISNKKTYHDDSQVTFKKIGTINLKKGPILKNEIKTLSVSENGNTAVYSKVKSDYDFYNQDIYAYNVNKKQSVKLPIKGEWPVISGNGESLMFRKKSKIFIYELIVNRLKYVDKVAQGESDCGIYYDPAELAYNGKQIVYEKQGEIYLSSGNKITKLFPGHNPSISKDGRNMVFYKDHYNDGEEIYREVYLYNLQTKSSKRISKDFDGYTNKAIFFNQDQYIKFDWRGRSIIYDINKGTSEVYPFIKAISDSGELIIYMEQGLNNQFESYVGNTIDRTAMRLLFNKDTYYLRFNFDESGKKLFFTSMRKDDYEKSPYPNENLWLLNINKGVSLHGKEN